MQRLRSKLSFANVTAFIALFVALSGAAYAANSVNGKDIINGSITGKDIKKASIPLTALKKLPVGTPGPAGAPGAPGSALAYGHVNADGSLDAANSKNIALTKLTAQPGYYCVLASVPVKNVLVGGDGGLVGRIYDASFNDFVTSCPEGAASVEIAKLAGGLTNSAFFIVFN
jgi:hypothetical protein